MGLNAGKIKSPESKGSKVSPVAAGNYFARLVQVVDCGLQTQRPFKGEEKPPAHEIMLTYELVTEFMKDEDGKDLEDSPRWISEIMPIYSLKADRAKSTKRITALDPDLVHGGNLAEMAGLPCTVTIVSNVSKKDPSKVYTDVGNVTPPMKGVPIAELKNEPRIFDMDEPDLEVFETFPDWVKEKLKSNLEFKGSALEAALEGSPVKEEEGESTEEIDNPY